MGDIISQWDNAAAKYIEEQEHSVFAESNKRIIKGRFQQLDGKNLLDIGCGYGSYTDYFRSIGAKAVGVDGSEKMIEKARERYPLTDFLAADITKPLPFENERFDIVFSNQVFMDIEDVEFVFSECKRVLKAGGILYYSIVHPAFYDGRWVEDKKGYMYAKQTERYITPYRFTNKFWGETEHFHRPLSYYLNLSAKYGLVLRQACEPVSYDGTAKNSDLPLFFFAEYEKRV